MTDAQTNAVVILLANDALEASGNDGAEAAIILMDAASSILLSRLPGDGARRMAGMLATMFTARVDTFGAIGGAA